jgi:HSP20 family protein
MRLFKRHRSDPASTPVAPATATAPAVDELAGPTASSAAAAEPSSTLPPAPTSTPASTAVQPSVRFDQLFDGWMASPLAGWTNEVVRIDRTGDDGALVVRAELAGLDPAKDVELTVSDGMLWIDGAHRDEQRTEENGVVRHEVHYGGFTRSIPLPDGVQAQDLEASAYDGVLEIRIPAAVRRQVERVPIRAGAAPGVTS